MKKDLLSLIDKIDYIKSCFHKTGKDGFSKLNRIYDIGEFIEWKQEIQFELQCIYDQNKDDFIWSTLVLLKQGFEGWKDEQSFYELSGNLYAIKKNINKYYPIYDEETKYVRKVFNTMKNEPKVFISHSSKDKDYVISLVKLLEGIGLTEKQIFCSSVPGYDIPLDEDIYDYLKKQFQIYDLHIIFILSENYYSSISCLNEMGAAWLARNKYTTILLPNYEFKEIKGAINPRQIGVKLDDNLTEVKAKLGELKDNLIHEFGLDEITDVRWEQKRDYFINEIIGNISPKQIKSSDALLLLKTACDDIKGTILK